MDGSFAMELAKVLLQKLGFASCEPPAQNHIKEQYFADDEKK
jgi:hypothetical protein